MFKAIRHLPIVLATTVLSRRRPVRPAALTRNAILSPTATTARSTTADSVKGSTLAPTMRGGAGHTMCAAMASTAITAAATIAGTLSRSDRASSPDTATVTGRTRAEGIVAATALSAGINLSAVSGVVARRGPLWRPLPVLRRCCWTLFVPRCG